MSKYFSLVVGTVCAIALYAFAIAPRKVIIPADSSGSSGGKIKLINGSAVSVNYGLKCYNDAGILKFTKTGQTLAAKAVKEHGGVQPCGTSFSNNSASMGSNWVGMISCGAYVTYADAATSCGSHYSLCTYSEYTNGMAQFWSSGWAQPPAGLPVGGAVGTWSYGSTPSPNAVGDVAVYTNTLSSSYRCFTAISGGGTQYNYCNGTSSGATAISYCCPLSTTEIPISSCEVEIESSTAADGYLQSPQFKGGAAF